MRRLHRPRPLTLALSVLAPVLLVVGIWLGSQPEHLPGFVRGIFVDEQTQVVADAFDLIEDDYVRKVPKGKLSDAAIKGMVASLDDQFSNYFTPAGVQALPGGHREPLLGRRPQRRGRRRGPADHAGLRRVAGVARRPEARRRHRRGRRQVAEGRARRRPASRGSRARRAPRCA